ncbi:M10 family metallopeptidase C-terminal domain-containing protein [Xaviernesmea oryzae]|nr:M10 family metallopeptidase C-terminal domain-containing protein [Xaviernesmea oryzae]SEL70428.1 serralysin [Xaviernesmea oryzae]
MASLTTSISPTGDPMIDGVLAGVAWAGPKVTYAFPTSLSSYSYASSIRSHFAPISASQKKEALFFLEKSSGTTGDDGFSVEGFTRLSLSLGTPATADIRFAQSSNHNKTAYAYYPSGSDEGGDIFFGTTYLNKSGDYRKPIAGNYAWQTLVHELGHALGLSHGHETDPYGALPDDHDSVEYSVMTYRSFIGAAGTSSEYEEFGAPQSFMMADIAALQAMYGANFSTNSGDTVYRWTPDSGATIINGKAAIMPGANRIFATIWDGGGVDTFDLSAYKTKLVIDLRPGASSTFSADQLAFLGGGPHDGYASGNIYNALLYHGDERSLIENVEGGSGNDLIIGNQAANQLAGGAGNDTLFGADGDDVLIGGAGADKLDGGAGNDTASYARAKAGLRVDLAHPGINTGEAAGDSFVSIENLTGSRFADRLSGDDGNNVLDGGAGKDVILGGAGDDWLIGGLGADVLTGGSGADHFVFRAMADSTPKAFDRITDFTPAEGDRIDLSAIDAMTKVAGHQAFTFIGTAGFSKTGGELRYEKTSSETILYADVNGDRKADFVLHLDQPMTLDKTMFLV